MEYAVTFKASAEKELGKLAKALQRRIIGKAMALGNNPRPAGSVKLAGSANLWRIRVGDYRVVYLIDDSQLVVDIRIVAHRRDVYRGL